MSSLESPSSETKPEQVKTNELLNKDISIIDISDDEAPMPSNNKRRRLIKNGNLVNNNVVEMIVPNDEKPIKLCANKTNNDDTNEEETMASEEELPAIFKRSKKEEESLIHRQHNYIIFKEDTDEELQNNNIHIDDTNLFNINNNDKLAENIPNYNNLTNDEAGVDLYDSDMYSVKYVSDGDDDDSFINDGSTDYYSTDVSDDDF
nr:hypothetical protein [Tanacetum cinerariifolium]